jgi:hypothetical protein
MTKTIELYEARAKEAADEARDATLENVRLRALRSEAAWRGMADRAIAAEAARGRRIADATRTDDTDRRV